MPKRRAWPVGSGRSTDPARASQLLADLPEAVEPGVHLVAQLLALNDDGAPVDEARHAGALAAMGIPAFACTPDIFPDLMAAAIQRQDLTRWVAQQGLAAQRAPARWPHLSAAGGTSWLGG